MIQFKVYSVWFTVSVIINFITNLIGDPAPLSYTRKSIFQNWCAAIWSGPLFRPIFYSVPDKKVEIVKSKCTKVL